jgi:uncharacterized glyoxalase superfamily protein PhnB
MATTTTSKPAPAKGKAQAIPQGFHTLSPHITVKGGAKAIDLYKKAFGAQELVRMPGPDGKSIMHAMLMIGDSPLLLNDENPDCGAFAPAAGRPNSVTLHLYVPNADEVFQRATKAGMETVMPLEDMFWGDRYGVVRDPFGHQWAIATHTHDYTPEQIKANMAKAFGPGGECCGGH